MMTGGQAVVECLIKAGVKTVFGLPGVQNDWLYNAFYDYRDQIKVLHTRHEQGTAYMALGYYLSTGKPAVFNIVPGPGFLNSSGGLATAWGLNAQLLCLVGQVPTKVLGKGYGVLHEIADQRGILASLTKYSDHITNTQEIPEKFAKVWSNMINGRPRPVGLEVAMDMLQSKAEIDFSNFKIEKESVSPDTGQIAELVDMISASNNPLIFVASGAVNASAEVLELAEFIQAPTFSYRTGKGTMPSSHYLSYPTPAAHELWSDCDLVIGIGTHCRMPMLKWGKEGINYVSINIDETVHNTFCESKLAITADAKLTLEALNQSLKENIEAKPSRKEEMMGFSDRWKEKTAYLEPQASYLKAIREVMPDDGIFVDELTQVGFASRILWETDQPRTYLSTGHMGTLGWGFMTALGAKVARPEAMVISVAGDGGFMFGVQELATAVQHKIGLIVLLFNNGLFGNVRSMQEDLYDNRVIATDLHNPDFVKMAEAFGAHAIRVEGVESMKAAIQDAAGRDLPTIIEIPVGNDWPSTNKFKALPKLR
jgi:acetolactate synthase-1/2/3 large subunit